MRRREAEGKEGRGGVPVAEVCIERGDSVICPQEAEGEKGLGSVTGTDGSGV